MKRVILLGHQARVGKDTLANFLEGEGYTKISFADKLKQVVADLYGFSREQMYGDLKDVEDLRYPNMIDQQFLTIKSPIHGDMSDFWRIETRPNPEYKRYLTPRRILQIFGQQQRSLYPDIWAANVFRTIDCCLVNANYVVPDFRFPNEYAVAKRWEDEDKEHRKLVVIKIERPDAPIISGASDESETALNTFEQWNAILVNDATPRVLYNKFKIFQMLSGGLK